MPADSGEPKAMINLTTSFVCTLLTGGRRGMKPVLAAVSTALQIYTTKMAVLNQPATGLLARVDTQSTC